MAKTVKRPVTNEWLESKPDRPRIDTEALEDSPKLSRLQAQVLSDQEVSLTDEKAAAYVDLPIFRGERHVSDRHVQFLYDEMSKGSFNPHLVTLATAELDGIVYKINGQHTCWAKMYANNYSPKVREIKYKVRTEEQLRQLYASFDRGMTRSDKHVTMVELANNESLKTIPINVMKFLAAAIKTWLYESKQERRRCSPADLAALISGKHLNLFILVGNFYHEFVGSHRDTIFMRRSAVAAAMFETFNKVPTLAAAFWNPVIDGVGLESRSDPRWQLRFFLQNAVINSASRKGHRSVSEDQMYNHCIPAFNKWRKAEECKQLRPSVGRVRAI